MNMRSDDQKARFPPRGWTVTEMLVAAVVVALLAGVSVPLWGQMSARAKAAACRGNLLQIGTALAAYLNDHDLEYPAVNPGRRPDGGDGATLPAALGAYLEDDGVFRCPADGDGVWERTGTSYYWNSVLNGQRAGELSFFGVVKNAAKIPVVVDKEEFHRSVGDGVNVLYADGHVDSAVSFGAASE
jgi:prepilin-type processing-associated H-X9-DG protein